MTTTKVDPKLNESGATKGKTYQGLTSQQLIDAYRIMFTSRRIDDREGARCNRWLDRFEPIANRVDRRRFDILQPDSRVAQTGPSFFERRQIEKILADIDPDYRPAGAEIDW